MRRINTWRVAEGICLLGLSLWCSMIWFLPVFWELAPEQNTVSGAWNSILFSTSAPESFFGTGIDLQGTIWVFHTVQEILAGNAGTVLNDVYAPIGFDLGKNEGFAWADALFAVPLMWFLDTPGWYNLHVLLTLTLSYWGCMLLYRKAGAPLLMAIGLALLSINNGFVRMEVFHGRPTQVHLILHAGFLMSVLQLLNVRSSWWWASFGGICGAGMILVYWFGGVAVGFCAAIALVLMGWKRGVGRRVAQAGWMAVLSVGIPLIVTWRISKSMLLGEGDQLFDALSVPPVHTVSLLGWTIPIQSIVTIQDWYDVREVVYQAGLVNDLLMLSGIAVLCLLVMRRHWGWVVVLVVAIGIPTAPAFVWNDTLFVSGQALLHSVFSPLPRCSFPHRMVVAPLLCMGIVISVAVRTLSVRGQLHPVVTKAAILGLSIWMIVQGVERFPSERQTTVSRMSPDVYLVQAAQKWPGGIITVPMEENSDTIHIQQLYHKQPILVGPGMDAVRPDGHEEYCAENSFLQALELMAREKLTYTPSYEQEDLKQLWADGFRLVYIMTNRSKSSVDQFQRFLGHSGELQHSGQLAVPLPRPN